MRKRAELDQARSVVLFVGNTETSASTGTAMRARSVKEEEHHSPIIYPVCERSVSYGRRRKSGVWGWVTGIIYQGPSCEPWRRSPRGVET